MLVWLFLVLVVGQVSLGDWTYPDDIDDSDSVPNSPHAYHAHYHHHHHHHDPEYHEGYQNKDGPVRQVSASLDKIRSNYSKQIPLDYVRQLNTFNVTDLLLNYVDGDVDDSEEGFLLSSRFGGDSQERSAAVMPKEAGCAPELITVKVAYSDDPSVLYIPQCTRIERCGGCCSHTLLSCQPNETETVSYKVIKTQYTGAKKLKLVGKEIVLLERHTKCKCDCRLQPEDCNKFQEYRRSECRCACANVDEEKKCYKNNGTKLWNPDLCACQCREVRPCSTGYTFDHNECKCVASTLRRRYASYEQSTYKREPSPSDD